jgi:hypothetical protein
MSKLKILKLLRKKEIISRQSASDVVVKLDAELEKCKRVTRDIDEIAHQKAILLEKSNCYSFQIERQLLLKLMEQKEILVNRQEFLTDEKQSASLQLSKIQKKVEYFESVVKETEIKDRTKKLDCWEENQLKNNKR